jgi:hypothetical protein
MLEFLSGNWLWILLIGGMLFMYLRHGRGHGGHVGCGGHQHSASEQQPAEVRSVGDRLEDARKHPRAGCH